MTTIVVKNGVVYSDTKTTLAIAASSEELKATVFSFLNTFVNAKVCQVLKSGLNRSKIMSADLMPTVADSGKVVVLDNDQSLTVEGQQVKVAAFAGDLLVGVMVEELLRDENISDINDFCDALGALEKERLDIIDTTIDGMEASTLTKSIVRQQMKETTFFCTALVLENKKVVVVYRRSLTDIGQYTYRIYGADETIAIGSGGSVQHVLKLIAVKRGWVKGDRFPDFIDPTTIFKQTNKLNPLVTFLLGAGLDTMSNLKLRITKVNGKPWWKFW